MDVVDFAFNQAKHKVFSNFMLALRLHLVRTGALQMNLQLAHQIAIRRPYLTNRLYGSDFDEELDVSEKSFS